MRRSSKISSTRPSKRSSYRRTSTKKSEASTLYLDWAEAEEYASKNRPITSSASAGARSVGSAPKSTKSASSFLSLNVLLQETTGHIANATSSSRSLGGMMKRKPSNRNRHTAASTSSRELKKTGSSGMFLSDLASEISSLCSASLFEDVNNDGGDDDDDKSITFEDLRISNNCTPDDDGSGASSSSRSLFNKFVDHVKTAASNSTGNLGSISEISEGLAEEVAPTKHRSAYFNNRISIRVRRASDLLFSSHHGKVKDLEDLLEEE